MTTKTLLALTLSCASHNIYAVEKSDSTSIGNPQTNTDDFNKFRFGLYGEVMTNFMDYGLNRFGTPLGNTKVNRNSVSLPRLTFSLDYKINDKWMIATEVEFEAGGTGTTYEMEKNIGSENGEYETEIEKGGEVCIEQFHITRLINKAFNLRFGHMVIPVGAANIYHEPINYFSTACFEGESSVIPASWHETGLSVYGEFGNGTTAMEYEAMVVAGLNANGFDMYNWVKGGKQGFFETDNFTSPAYIARLVYCGVKGLKVGASFYYCDDAIANSDKPQFYSSLGKVPVRIFSVDSRYTNKYLTAWANFLTGSINNSAGVTSANKHLSSKSPYSRQGPVAKNVITYSGELGFSMKNCLNLNWNQDVIPFVHYEYYNPQHKGEASQVMDTRCEVSQWQVGVNWRVLPNLIFKADYATRQIGTKKFFGKGKFNSENEFCLALTYTGWLISR